MKRKSSISPVSSGSFLRCPHDRRILFIFGQTDCWWARYLKGFTHVVMAEFIDDGSIMVVEPTLLGGRLCIRDLPLDNEWSAYTVLELVINPTRKNRLIRPLFQSCATVVQYLSGISMRAITAQGLYSSLIKADSKGLLSQGIKELNVWVPKPY